MISNHRQHYRKLQATLRAGRDLKLLKRAKQSREQGFGWRYDGLSDWTTEAIFNQLQAIGVDTSQECFEQQARAAGRAFELEARWRRGIAVDKKRDWDDFPFVASEELWDRLTPQLLCPEVVARRIEAAMERPEIDPPSQYGDYGKAQIEAACMLMDYIETFEPGRRQSEFEAVIECSNWDISEWLVASAEIYGQHCLPEVRRIAQIMQATRSGEYLSTDLADSLMRAGRNAEARTQSDQNLARWPDSVWVQLMAGEVFNNLNETERAVQCYSQGLKIADNIYDWDFASERAQALLSRLGRDEEWSRLKEAHPRPIVPTRTLSDNDDMLSDRHFNEDWIGRSDPLTGESASHAPLEPMSLSRGTRIGRNEICPCGSGKKYKKCCLSRESAMLDA